MNNLLSYCELIDAKIRASDKDLPVKGTKYPHNVSGLYFCRKVLIYVSGSMLCSSSSRVAEEEQHFSAPL